MQGVAQRVLPLLAEPETASPAGSKRDREASRRPGEYLWQVYQALPQEHKCFCRSKQ